VIALRKWSAGAALLFLTMPSIGHAVTEANFSARTTGDLVELCDPKSDSAMANAAINFCHGFAQGAVSVEMQHDAASRSMKLFCLPNPPPTRTETLSEFVKWGRASPDRMGEPAADGLFRFLGERFPCPKAR
jgi:Rap1a immunity proteins